MGLKPLPEFRRRRLFDHLRQGLGDLLFGIIDIFELMLEQVAERLDVVGEQSHRGHSC
jgi:hypothetical protein